MDYVPPRDAVNPTDPYVDENPAAGISGSVVPAAFFNLTQREIVDVIGRAGLTPDATLQLADAIVALILANASGGGGPGGGVPTTRQILTAAGLAGGGTLNEDRTIALDTPGLTAAAAITGDDLFAIFENGVGGHRKATVDALAAYIAATPGPAEVYTATTLYEGSGASFTVNPLPSTRERIYAEFTSVAGQWSTANLQAYVGGAWATIASVTGTGTGGTGSEALARGSSTALLYAAAASKLWTLNPGPLAALSGVVLSGGAPPGGVANPGYAAMTLAALAATGAWDGQLRISGTGALSRVVKLSPLVIA